MREITGFVWEIFINFIEAAIYIQMLMRCQPIRGKWAERKRELFFGAVSVITLLVSICNFQEINSIILQLLCLICYQGFSFLFFQSSFSEKLFVSCLPAAVIMLSDKLTFFLGGFLFPEKLRSLLFGGEHRVYATLMYLLLCSMFAGMFIQIFQYKLYIPQRFRTLLLVLVFLSIVSTNFFLEILIEIEEMEVVGSTRMKLNLVSLIFFVLLYLMFFMIWQMGQVYHNNLLLERKLQEDAYDKKQLDFFLQSINCLRTWKHDYQNHLTAIDGFLDREDTAGLKAYLETLRKEIPENFFVVSSGNPVVDAIVTNKYNRAKQYQIEFWHTIFLPEHFMLGDTELTAVLGNLLDNAVEGCIRAKKETMEESKESKICLTMKPYRDMYCIQVVNTSDGHYLFDSGGHLESSKKEKELHGNGIRRVREIVENAGGIFQVLPEKGLFTAKIVLPMEVQGETDESR